MVGSVTAMLPTKHRQSAEKEQNNDYENQKAPEGMTAQRMQCFKTKRCRFWLEARCTRGDRCTYAHTDVELRIPPDLTKTKICTRWRRGTCDKSAGECAYAHGVEDLREAVTPSTTGTMTGRVSTTNLSFGVPSPSNKLRDSAPYSSRSCQTISSNASTHYTSRRDSESSSDTPPNKGSSPSSTSISLEVSSTTTTNTTKEMHGTQSQPQPLMIESNSPTVSSHDLISRSSDHDAMSEGPTTSGLLACSPPAVYAQFFAPTVRSCQSPTRRQNEAGTGASRWPQTDFLLTSHNNPNADEVCQSTEEPIIDELLLAVLTTPYYD